MSLGNEVEPFRAAVHEAVDRLVGHWRALADERLPVTRPGRAPGATVAALPALPPEQGEPLDRILQDTWDTVVPGLVHWQHPAFLAYYPTGNSPASVLAELVTAGLGVQGMMWTTGPAATELEQVVTDWLAQALGLPGHFLHTSGNGGGVIQDSASSAVLVAVVAALHRASRGRWRDLGTEGRYRLYRTDQANSCVAKAARVAGLGESTVVPTLPGTARMDPRALRERLAADRAAGGVPAIVVATVGTTGTCAVDPLADIGRICREEGVWLHVDAAYAGPAALCPEFRWLNDGVGAADSYAVNAHKWMRTGTPCNVMWTSDRRSLTEAMSVSPPYLRNEASDTGAVVDYRDWQIPLGRPMRALKLWYVMRAHGLQGLREAIRHDVRMAALLAELVAAEAGFHLVTHRLGLVVFRLDTDPRTREVARSLAGDPALLLSSSTVDGRPVLRAALGSPLLTEATVHRVWRTIRRHAAPGGPTASEVEVDDDRRVV
ncbi:pyridoxal phosphate-dependent decarboxylase family protein [Streptomyces corynorhini]|uniref:Aspartate aminotransferase family protein n=1 Tax=Streptomyces corynorhini TaxID=2282652 RepID=A0A370B4A4_9ACTN|nr:pyridoxal-dependent decarboxylase [Streptomyces corynorhini]RDG34914.1 aspartate aminotransferase family protein [Streptomyces corynorhini]